MSSYRYAFIGGGVMAEAILRGVLGAGIAAPGAVTVSDPLDHRRQLHESLGVNSTHDNAAAAAGADLILLAVKPATVPHVLRELAPALRPDQVLVSIAAGVRIAKLEGGLSSPVPVVRVMPNILATVGAAATAMSPGSHASPAHVQLAREVFETVGSVVEVPESHLNAVTGLSGSGPAYVMLIIEALADGGVLAGLPRSTALELATQTVLGSAQLLKEKGEHPAVWRDRVATPGGTTIAGLAELEKAGVRHALIACVLAATHRADELAEKE